MSTVPIVTLLPTDCSALVALELATFGVVLRQPTRTWRYALRPGHALAFGVRAPDHLRAAIIARRRRGSRWLRICLLAVEPALRRQGVGRRLLATVLDHADPGSGLSLEVHAEQHDAQRFYRRLGFVSAGEIPDFYADGATALRLRCAGALAG